MIPSIRIILIALLLSTSFVVHAASDNFLVRTLVGEDLAPPSTPSALTATPVATTQIDLTWASSTDNHILSGYQVFRDALQIATTTTNSYSDVGLTPATLYTYYVTAFDSSGNISASSTEVATTTLASTTPAVSTPEEATETTYGSRIRLELLRLEVLPERELVTIRYETNGYVRGVIRWGKTVSYELGSLAERSYSKTHVTQISGLQPGTTYKFIIEGENSLGITGVLAEGEFTTLPPDDVFPPSNVRDFSATQSGDAVVLSWINPEESDFAKVRIIGSDQFYPSDLVDGWVVYEGVGEVARDPGRVVPGRRLYYTAFAYDENGNISSGAVATFRLPGIGESGTPTTTPPLTETTNPIALTFTDLKFFQEGNALHIDGGQVVIDGTKQLVVMLPYDVVPEHLKTILVTLTDSVDPEKEFTFLLRVNTEKTAYVSFLAPLGVSGLFPLRVSVFDYTTAQVGYASGVVRSEIMYVPPRERTDEGFVAFLTKLFFSATGGYMFWFILLLILLAFGTRRILHEER